MKIYKGTIITCDSNSNVFRYLVEDRGRVVYTGDTLPACYKGADVVNLGKKAVCPAFGDTHIHYLSYAIFSGGLDVRSSKSNRQMIGTISDYLSRCREKIVLGFGASAHFVSDKKLITKHELDQASVSHPVFIVKYDGHAAIINSSLMKMLPKRIFSKRGFNAESGLLEHEAFFAVTDFVTSSVSLPNSLLRMLHSVDRMASRGIGMIHSVSGVGFPLDLDVALESLFAGGLRNDVAFRVFFQTMNVNKVLKRKLPRIGGCFATALDGSFGSLDAALIKPYKKSKNHGVLFHSDDEVLSFVKEANRAGLQIELHAIGDRAFEQAAIAFDAALKDYPRDDHRHTIIHACLPTNRGLDICAKNGVSFAVQPSFIDWPQEPLDYLESILGKRAYKLSPLKSILNRGIVMSAGSDAPCTLPDPIAGISAAVNHYVAGEALSVQQALNLYTRNAAWAGFDEKERGSLELGKRADLVVLDRNILKQPAEKVKNTSVVELILNGKPYLPGQGRSELLLRGLLQRRKI
ncbi:MAG: amidohydrolase family protein [Spirochaetes bacterium]|jgi:predicted amidohydrolase YtcJ|nr:amidohydrolase family protein [Spirochaetota bacterium]